MKNLKGQSFSFDAIIAAIIFVVAIFSFFSFLLFSQATNDYKKDIIDKEMIRVSALLMSEDPVYGIMDSAISNRIMAETGMDPLTDMNARIKNVDDTSPYGICIQIRGPVRTTFHPSDCNMAMQNSISQVRTARIVIDQLGNAVSMSINLYDKPSSG
jgi:hypothetical protein